jgi:hypothetical protein
MNQFKLTYVLLIAMLVLNYSAVAAGSPITVSEQVGESTVTITHPAIKAKGKKTWQELVPPKLNWLAGADTASTITFEEDVKVNGLRLNSGTYGFYIYVVDENDWQFVFNRDADPKNGSYDKKDDAIRIAVLNQKANNRKQLRIGLENFKPSKRKSKADLAVHFEKKKALVHLEWTGERRNKGLDPDLPGHLEAPWLKVLNSMKAIAAEDFVLHTEDFAKDFDTDFGDGADKDGHIQFLDNISRGGMTDNMGLNAEDLEYGEEDEQLTFTNFFLYSRMGTINMIYTLEERDGEWVITYLSAEE